MSTLPKLKDSSLRPDGSGNSEDPAFGKPVALHAKAKARFRAKESVFADNAFRSLVFACAIALLAIVGTIVFELITQSHLSMSKFGLKFLARSIWDPVAEDFGALPFIYGTLVSSFIALLLAVPLSVGTALFLTELCPDKLRGTLSLLVELLAAIPSVIYGLWGIFVLAPFLRAHVEPFLQD
jgi:phosphate transport system permease protein